MKYSKYVWTIKPIELFNMGGTTYLYRTNCRKIKFGEEMFVNSNAHVQRKKTLDFIGLVLKTGKNLTMDEHFKLTYKLKKKVAKQMYNGKTYSQYE